MNCMWKYKSFIFFCLITYLNNNYFAQNTELKDDLIIADTIVKNTTQRENLKTAFREVYGAKGTEAVKGLNVMLDVLEAQGRRLPAGSPTAEKGMLAEESIGLLGKGFRNIPGVIGNLYQNIFYGRDYEKIAKAITSPNGIETLEAIAKAGKDQKKIALGLTEFQQIIKATEAEDQSVQFAR